MRIPGLVLAAAVILCAGKAPAQPAARRDSVQIVRAEGYASIYAGDLARARDEALADARVRALESLGFWLEGDTFLSRGRVLDHGIKTRTSGFISQSAILEEGRQADVPELYRVKIQAWVKLALSAAETRRARRKFSVVLDLPQDVLHEGQTESVPMSRRTIERAIRDALVEDGFDVYDRELLSQIHGFDALLARARTRDPLAVNNVGEYALAEVVVTGRISAEYSATGPDTKLPTGQTVRGYFYHAFADVFAMEGTSSNYVATYANSDGAKGYQLSPRKAAAAAVNQLREPAAQAVLQGLRGYAGSNLITVTVVVAGLPDMSKYRFYNRFLKGLRWVSDVEANDFHVDGRSTYRVKYKEKFFFLLSQMHRVPGLVQVEGSNLQITATYTDLP